MASEVGLKFWEEEGVNVGRCDSVPDAELKRVTKSNPRALEPRFISLALLACEEALLDSGLTEQDFDRLGRNVGVSLGSGMGSATSEIPAAVAALGQGKKLSPYFVPRLLANLAGGNVSIAHNFQGPLLCPSTACASGAHAIADALHMIQRGDVEVCVCGGTESVLDKMSIAGFHRLKALSTNPDSKRASIPFDEQRDGFVMGEGAGVLVLESEEHFLRRQVGGKRQPYAIVRGAGMSGDANHVTSPHPGGRGAESAMRMAMKSLDGDFAQVGYCNAHATSTPMGDLIEADAIGRVFAHQVAVSSTKSSLGHLLGAAGAVEAAITALSLHHSVAPGTVGLDRPDPKLPPHLAFPKACSPLTAQFALTNSFGFGGTNVSLLLERAV